MAEDIKEENGAAPPAEEQEEKAEQQDISSENENGGQTAEEELASRIEALEKELEEEKEKYLRLDAEYYNYRTRSLKEKQEAYDNALIKAVTEILSVIDNFERAAAAECSDSNYKKGVEMIFKQYTAIIEKLGVQEIEALGQPFDPNFHNAVSSVTDEELEENTVAAVLQKGYILGKKVIRHAMVTVANP